MPVEVNETTLCDQLRRFQLDKVLSQDLTSPSIYLLGTIDSVPSILHLEKSHFDVATLTGRGFSGPGGEIKGDQRQSFLFSTDSVSVGGRSTASNPFEIREANLIEQNDIYTWALGWFSEGRPADLKIYLIWPCTEAHIKKYSTQKSFLFSETPHVYDTLVIPYIDSMPPARIQWVNNILDGKKEQDSVVHSEGGTGEDGFLIMPDSKWDRKNMKTLYLQAIVQSRKIRSMRDLEPKHVPLLKRIRLAAEKVCVEHYGLERNTIRVFVHYHPTYYHFHVHIVHVENEGHHGTRVGKAHMLDDLISLLELSAQVSPEQSLVRKMTYSYVLREQEALYGIFKAAGQLLDEPAEDPEV